MIKGCPRNTQIELPYKCFASGINRVANFDHPLPHPPPRFRQDLDRHQPSHEGQHVPGQAGLRKSFGIIIYQSIRHSIRDVALAGLSFYFE
jgi:hypothetical protein